MATVATSPAPVCGSVDGGGIEVGGGVARPATRNPQPATEDGTGDARRLPRRPAPDTAARESARQIGAAVASVDERCGLTMISAAAMFFSMVMIGPVDNFTDEAPRASIVREKRVAMVGSRSSSALRTLRVVLCAPWSEARA